MVSLVRILQGPKKKDNKEKLKKEELERKAREEGIFVDPA